MKRLLTMAFACLCALPTLAGDGPPYSPDVNNPRLKSNRIKGIQLGPPGSIGLLGGGSSSAKRQLPRYLVRGDWNRDGYLDITTATPLGPDLFLLEMHFGAGAQRPLRARMTADRALETLEWLAGPAGEATR